MAYTYKVDTENRKFHFAILTSDDKKNEQKDQVTEGDQEENIKDADKTKGKMMRAFLAASDEYFTLSEVSEMLKVSRDVVAKMIVAGTLNQQGKKRYADYTKLETYDVQYYWAKNHTEDFSKWFEIKKSNINKLVHVRDLYNFLLQTIKSSYEYLGGHSLVDTGKKGVLEDSFYRTKSYNDDRMKDKTFCAYLKHSHSKKEIEKIVLAILKKDIELHSVTSLKDIFPKSHTSYQRLTGCLDVVRFNFNGSSKDSPRYVFMLNGESEEARNKEIEQQLTGLLSILSRYKIAVIPMQLKETKDSSYLKVMEFKEPIDYLSLYREGYKKPPKGYYQGSDGKLYFAVEYSPRNGKGLNIREKLLDQETYEKGVSYLLAAEASAREKMKNRNKEE